MARMIPPVVPEGTPSAGEREIFNELAAHPGAEDWIVLHSLDTAVHVKRVFGEVDFVILVPEVGVLCLEVKATSHVRRERGIWYYGSSGPDYRGPFKQAAQAMHSVREYVRKEVPGSDGIIFWSAVCFPYTEFTVTSSEWHPWQVFDQRAVRAHGYPYAILKVLKSARAYLEEKGVSWLPRDKEGPSTDDCDLIARRLRPEFEVFESPKSRRHRLREELKRYTQEQMRALDSMEGNDRVLFTGPAGTGKTLLAIEGARRAASRGKKVLLLCFNRLLQKAIADEVKGSDLVVASTLHRFMLDCAGTSPRSDTSFWTDDLPDLALDALVEEEPEFDLLIVDEAQDILRTSYLAVLDELVKGGLKDGAWFFFGDFEKQQIYGHEVEIDELVRESRPARYQLRTNCRNTPHIAQAARYYGRLDPPYDRVLRPDNGVNVRIDHYAGLDEQHDLLVSTLDALYDDGISGEDIVILSPNAKRPAAASLRLEPWSSRIVPFTHGLKGQIGYTTIHAFKGREAPTVIATDIERVVGLHEEQLFYVATTRAVERLVILAHDDTRPELQSILTTALTGGPA